MLINFENYMEHIGGMEEEQLARLPGGIWPVIDVTAYGLSGTFINEHNLAPAELVRPGGVELGETLAFLLKVAWERGYFMLAGSALTPSWRCALIAMRSATSCLRSSPMERP